MSTPPEDEPTAPPPEENTPSRLPSFQPSTDLRPPEPAQPPAPAAQAPAPTEPRAPSPSGGAPTPRPQAPLPPTPAAVTSRPAPAKPAAPAAAAPSPGPAPAKPAAQAPGVGRPPAPAGPPPSYARYGAQPPPADPGQAHTAQPGIARRAPSGRPRSSFGVVLLSLFFGLALGLGVTTCDDGGVLNTLTAKADGPRVGVVEVVGPIMDAKEVVDQLYAFKAREDLVGIVLRIDSPGGAVGPSQEIFAAMREASKDKPVVASMGGTAASGGFWISLGADWVFAMPGTITGSIGVISQTADLQGVAEALRFSMRTFKSGPLKDAGNPFRPVTEADREMFMGLIQDIYGQFVATTAARRGLSEAAVRAYADGRIFTGRAALKADLIDELGGLRDAARHAVLLARARKDDSIRTSSVARDRIPPPSLIYPAEPPPSLMQLLGAQASSAVERGLQAGIRDALRPTTQQPVQLR